MEQQRGVGSCVPPGEPPGAEPWTGCAANRVLWLCALLGAGCVALGVVLAVGRPWPTGPAALVMSVVGCVAAGLLVLFWTIASSRVLVRVDREGLGVRCGYLGVPRWHVALDRIAAVREEPRITPFGWGGWGYSRRPLLGTAVVVRRGPGIVVDLVDGHRLTVTVDDAAGAVRAIRTRLG